MSERPPVFVVQSKADLGIKQYILDEEGYSHILCGHRDLRSFVTGIKDTVENPTHVYRSNYHLKRFQFVSNSVTSAGGKPMNVIIEIGETQARVITASPRERTTGNIVWDDTSGLYASYDRQSDILYFSKGDSRSEYATDHADDERIWLRKYDHDDTPAGITVFDAAQLAQTKRQWLAHEISRYLNVSLADIGQRLEMLVK
jgi:uncharacterized protein YuzE